VRGIRRKEKAITDLAEMEEILNSSKYITIAMSKDNEPYLATLSHGYNAEEKCIYFHCAKEGKKIDILEENNVVWGQALIDRGYASGKCDHLYATTQFKGKVSFVEDLEEKRNALVSMINQLEKNPKEVIEKQINEKSLQRVIVGRIDIEFMSGKESKEVVIS